jgi:hypothetical protein
MTDEQIFAAVRTELARARAKYPAWPQDMIHAAAIGSEEDGEVTKAVNNFCWGHGLDGWRDIEKEAIQAIAMKVRFLADGEYTP